MNNALVDVSVIVPCFRCAGTIGRAIDSVLAQTVQPKELILIDDFSEDTTLAVLRQWEECYPDWIQVVALPMNQGAGMARNAGWAQAKGKYIAFLDADDSWHPQKLETQYAYMQAHADIDLCGHGHVIGPPSAKLPTLVSHQLPAWRLLAGNPFVTPSVMLKSGLSQRFSAGRRHMEDHLLWLEIILTGGQAVRIDMPLASLYKDQVGVAGLSNQIRAMSKADFGNYRHLYSRGLISTSTFLLCWIWASVKFCRRAFIYGLPRIWRRWLGR